MTDSPVALITGGGSGIGAATARRLLEQGHRVCVTGRRTERLRRFAQEPGEPAGLLALTGDASEDEDVQEAVTTTVERLGRPDAVVANAGFASFDTVTDGDPAVWRLAENTRRMVTGDGVGVTLVNPGATETNFFDADGGPPDRAMMAADAIVWAIGQPARRRRHHPHHPSHAITSLTRLGPRRTMRGHGPVATGRPGRPHRDVSGGGRHQTGLVGHTTIWARAEKAGATILKPAGALPWAGYGGTFADTDVYIWSLGYSTQGGSAGAVLIV
jgi:NAD(P)-dependent dehydrogenase (short-subunit alcohol dehydrogenase family)